MRKREGKKERERGQKKREKEKEGEERDQRTDASDGHLVQAVLTGMGLRRSRTSAHAPNRVTYWEAPASNIGACAEPLWLTGRHRPPTSAHAPRTPSLTGRQRAPTSAHALRPHRLLGGNSFPFVHYVAITKRSSYLHGNRLSTNKGSLEQAFLWFLPGRRVFTKNYWPWDFPSATVADIPRSQSRGPGLDLVWERDPTCHNWVCMHDEDPTQLNK